MTRESTVMNRRPLWPRWIAAHLGGVGWLLAFARYIRKSGRGYEEKGEAGIESL